MKIILIIVICFLVWYFGFAFVTLDIDFRNWEANQRLLFLAESFATSIGAVIIYILRKNNS